MHGGRPRGDHTHWPPSRGVYLTGLHIRRARDAEAWRRRLSNWEKEREKGGSARLCSLCFSFSFPPWSPGGSWKEARQARNPKVWMPYSMSSARAEQSSPGLEALGFPNPLPSVLSGGEEQVLPLGPPPLADRCALWLSEQVISPLQQPRQTLAGTHDQL